MDKPVEMLQDEREIISVAWPSDPITGNPCHYATAWGHRIVCYGEPSHHCARPFIAIYNGGGELIRRIDASGAFIEYAASEGREIG